MFSEVGDAMGVITDTPNIPLKDRELFLVGVSLHHVDATIQNLAFRNNRVDNAGGVVKPQFLFDKPSGRGIGSGETFQGSRRQKFAPLGKGCVVLQTGTKCVASGLIIVGRWFLLWLQSPTRMQGKWTEDLFGSTYVNQLIRGLI